MSESSEPDPGAVHLESLQHSGAAHRLPDRLSEKTEEINKYIIPWSVNAIAIEASKYILIHPAQFTLPIRKWQRETAELIYQLNKLDGLEVQPTSTTFFWFA